MQKESSKREGESVMLYILYGNDPGRQEFKLKNLLKKEAPDETLRYHADEDDPSYPFSILDSVNLFGLKQAVVLDRATFLTAKNASLYKPEELLPYKNAQQPVILMVEAAKLDGRKKAVKELMEAAKCFECIKFDDQSLQAFLKEEIEKRNLTLAPDAFTWLQKFGGKDAIALENALDKLELYSDHITLEDVKVLVPITPEDNVFEMTNALFAKQPVRLLGLYRDFRRQGMEPLAISGLLASQVRFIFQVRAMMDEGMNQNQIAKKLEASSGRIWNSMKNARRFSAMELLGHLARLSKLDEQLKSALLDKDDLFERYILSMAEEKFS